MADFRDVPSSENDIYWITGGWAARLSTSLPHRDTHGPLLTCPAQSMGGQPQNRRLRRFTGASDFLDASSAVSNGATYPGRRRPADSRGKGCGRIMAR